MFIYKTQFMYRTISFSRTLKIKVIEMRAEHLTFFDFDINDFTLINFRRITCIL